jgi:Tc toxin complex TcA C-terminal TcB-binding domain
MELKSLGNSLLSALEKKDGEALSMMRTQHETMLLNMSKTVKKFQITEALYNREGLEKTQEVTKTRFTYYSELIDTNLIEAEKDHSKKLEMAKERQNNAYNVEQAANIDHLTPTGTITASVPPSTSISFGGSNLGLALNAWARAINNIASGYTYEANRSSINATNERRLKEWLFQKELAKNELIQINKQILSAQIREKIADQDLINHEQQIENALQVEEFYRNKFTQEELYGWMVGEISTVYFQCYQLAYDLAKKAEKTYRYELGLPTSNFVQFGIWDSFRKGLMSGEKLYLCLKQMEKSYMDQNRREFEITKNISLVIHDPMALITLKETGACNLDLPETLFDIDYPGHYMRRIKSISITIPCVVGPYTGINCTLTLLSSETRVKSTPQTPYAKKLGEEDNRFVQNFAATQSIATSTAQNDSGMFELNFRDERYLPFEGNGAISRWRIELPKDFRQFDYDTVSDVVLHIKYTAREGGASLRDAAIDNLDKRLKGEEGKLQSRLFSLRHEFPTEWHKLVSTADASGNHSQAFSLDKQRFPMVFKNGKIIVKKVDIFGNPKIPFKNSVDKPSLDKLILSSPDGEIILKNGNEIGFLIHRTSDTPDLDINVKDLGLNKNEADWTIKINKANISTSLEKLDDIFVLFHYIVDIPVHSQF